MFKQRTFFAWPFLMMVALFFCAHARAQIPVRTPCTDLSSCPKDSNVLRWFEKTPGAAAVWAPIGIEHRGAKSFSNWVRRATSLKNLPAFNHSLSLNCWEYVLYTSLKLETMNLVRVRNLYMAREQGKSLSLALGTNVGNANYTMSTSRVKISWPPKIKSHDWVFMDETGHVVQLLGETNSFGQQLVASFSPRPIWGDGSQERPIEGIRPEITTVESLIEEMIELYPDVPTDWNNIQLLIVRP